MPSNKKVLVNGCSFTAPIELINGTKNWPRHLPKTWEIKNLAQRAAGNKWICDATIASTIQDDYDLVLIMWSGLSRTDVLLDKIAWDQFWEFKSKNALGLYYGHCGMMGDPSKNPMLDIIKPIIKYSDERNLVFESLMNMLKLQSWLQAKNIDYRFMSFVNYWNNAHIEQAFGQGVSSDMDILVNAIDFSKWIFADTDKNGIFELAQNQNLLISDGIHPNSLAGELWAKIILDQLQSSNCQL